MSNDPSQEVPAADEAGADDSQVRPAVVPVVPAAKPPGKKTGLLAAVIAGDPRIIGRSSQPGEAKPEGGVDEYSVKLAQDLRGADPGFTAEKYQARASGAKPTLRMPAQAVIRQRKMRQIAIVGTILMFAFSATIVTRLVEGVWPWTLLWQVIRAA